MVISSRWKILGVFVGVFVILPCIFTVLYIDYLTIEQEELKIVYTGTLQKIQDEKEYKLETNTRTLDE